MEIEETGFAGLLIIKPTVFRDRRGYFFESYNQAKYRQAGVGHVFVQDNQSCSSYGIIRGLHYQLNPFSQTKLLRVLEGRIWDVSVDLRNGSPTFGDCYTIELTGENQLQLLIPKGFAHGFSVLSRSATILYKCDEYYHPEAERGFHYADPDLAIDWKLAEKDIIISDRDAGFPNLKEAEMNFTF